MDGPSITTYLRRLCAALDSGKAMEPFPWRRLIGPLAAPAILSGALLAGGCPEPEPVEVYGAPPAEVCGDGIDNDADGRVDCADDECAAVPPCVGLPPGHPEICDDGGDNDGDGLTDCQDPLCAGHPRCTVQPTPTLYAAPPMPPEVCGDGVDNDRNGLVDCLDAACAGRPVCSPQVSMYGAPPMRAEVCGDGIDNDRDGRMDCADDECDSHFTCAAVPAYGVPPIDYPPPVVRYRAPFTGR
jgi:hypothetical protein